MTSTPPAFSTPRRPAWQRLLLNRYTLLLVLAVLAAVAYFGWNPFRAKEDVKERYTFSAVQYGDIEDLVTATGTLQPRDYVDVGTQVSGQLKKIDVEIGSQVKAGDLLAIVDPTVYLTRVDANRAQLANQRAQMADRESQRLLAEQTYTRQKNLMAEDATTQEALQNAEAGLRSARAQVEALRAQIRQTESTLRGDEANLSYTKIYAPMSGTVVSVSAKQGQTVNASQQAPTLLRIADLSTMTVQTQVSEADIRKLRIGMPAYFTILGGQNRRWYSDLRKIEPTPVIQNNVVLYNALFDVPNPTQTLMTQMTAQVFFVLASANNTLVIPASAFKPTERSRQGKGRKEPAEKEQTENNRSTGSTAQEDRPKRGKNPAHTEEMPKRTHAEDSPRERSQRRGTVQVLKDDGTLEERQVTVGISNRVNLQVLSGLKENEQVVSGLRQKEKIGQRSKANAQSSGMGGMGHMPRMPR